jgi:hypothetical protein
MMSLIPLAFFIVALTYSMAGFGGGSSYIALLILSGFPLSSVPLIALVCNLVVSGQGCLFLVLRRQLRYAPLLPLLAGSIPCAFIAGAWKLQDGAYLWILSSALTAAGVALLLRPTNPDQNFRQLSPFSLFPLGAVLGFIAGLSGIGGGIFLAPVLHLLRANTARQIAGTASLFIALNSLAGILGQLTKAATFPQHLSGWIVLGCPVAVLLGGQIGSRMLSRKLNPVLIRQITGALVLLVAFRLWLTLFNNLA